MGPIKQTARKSTGGKAPASVLSKVLAKDPMESSGVEEEEDDDEEEEEDTDDDLPVSAVLVPIPMVPNKNGIVKQKQTVRKSTGGVPRYKLATKTTGFPPPARPTAEAMDDSDESFPSSDEDEEEEEEKGKNGVSAATKKISPKKPGPAGTKVDPVELSSSEEEDEELLSLDELDEEEEEDDVEEEESD